MLTFCNSATSQENGQASNFQQRQWLLDHAVNPLMGSGNYSATLSNMKLVHWPLMGKLLHLVQRGGDWAGPQPAQSLLAVANVTAQPSTASVPITVLLYS